MKTTSLKSRVVVIGAGVIGLFTAWRLAEAGFAVTVIERGTAASAATGAASWAAGGMLSPLPPDHVPEAIRALLDESLAAYPAACAQLNEESGINPEYWVCGADYVKGDGRRLHYPEMAQVRSPRLLQALVGALHRRGVEILERTEVHSYIETDDRLEGIRTNRGEIRSTNAILAAGAWSSSLDVPEISPIKGQMLLLQAQPGMLDRMLIGEEGYLIPRKDGSILAGSTVEDAGFDLSPTDVARQEVLLRATLLWSAAQTLPVKHHWAGLRPRSPVTAPIIGPHPRLLGLWLATGHFRLGVTLAPATAARLVRQLSGS